jgi:hypothetical protein
MDESYIQCPYDIAGFGSLTDPSQFVAATRQQVMTPLIETQVRRRERSIQSFDISCGHFKVDTDGCIGKHLEVKDVTAALEDCLFDAGNHFMPVDPGDGCKPDESWDHFLKDYDVPTAQAI